MTKLKPCPFCGNKAKIEYSTRSMVYAQYEVFCGTCGAQMPNWKPLWLDRFFDTEEDAINAWNRRVKE